MMDNIGFGLITFGANYLIIFIIIIALAAYFVQPEKDKVSMLVFSLLTFSLAYLAAKIIGHFYYDPRPFVVNHFKPIISHAPDNGFPSDHMLMSSAVAAVLYYYNKKVSLVLWVLAFIVGLSRICAGVHHWIDILGSIIISIIIAFTVKQCLKLGRNNQPVNDME